MYLKLSVVGHKCKCKQKSIAQFFEGQRLQLLKIGASLTKETTIQIKELKSFDL